MKMKGGIRLGLAQNWFNPILDTKIFWFFLKGGGTQPPPPPPPANFVPNSATKNLKTIWKSS